MQDVVDGQIRVSVRSFAGKSCVRGVPKLSPPVQPQSALTQNRPVIVRYRPTIGSLPAIPPNIRPATPSVPGAL